MVALTQLPLEGIKPFCLDTLNAAGYSGMHADAISDMLYTCQLDDCQSHGLYRLVLCVETIRAGNVDGDALPVVKTSENAVIKVDARNGMSLLSVQRALPNLVAKTRQFGIAALAVNNCYHFSALWPEVEALSAQGFAAISMLPSHAWVAPEGGTRGALGTNPLAFSWPRLGRNPFTFDFATSAFARGEIELYLRAGKPLPAGIAIDKDGNPTTDPKAAIAGAMRTFGGHKGSALSIMIELLAGPLINDLTSLESMGFAGGKGGAPRHGQLIIAFDPARFNDTETEANDARAERLFAEIVDQGARLPSQRRFAARERNLDRGYVEITKALMKELESLKD